MGRKCNVLDCPSDSRRPEDNGVTFHKMPFHPDLRPKWIELCRVPEERQVNKVIYVCSRHFRRTDFCNFKGTKYMLKQGALPSVFPWTKSLIKLSQAEKSSSELANVEIKEEPLDSVCKTENEIDALVIKVKKEFLQNEDEEKSQMNMDEITIKTEPDVDSGVLKVKSEHTVAINFFPGTRIEANDFNEKWYPATILEVDYDENEVFVEFDKNLNKANEWIPMDSSRLRPYQPRANVESYIVGERCMATWNESCSKFPATIRRVMDEDTYEVLFDDGFTKVLKYFKLSKLKGSDGSSKGTVHASPLFDPVVGSKEERRERKRKINVAELFGVRKKPKHEEPQIKTEIVDDEKMTHEDVSTTNASGQCEGEEWTCRWLNGEPVGVESTLESSDGPKRSIVVPDHRLPTGWEKHLTQRTYGNSAGKWDATLVNPDGKKFHSRHAVKSWLEENKLDFHIDQFDFCLHLNRAKKLGLYEVTDPDILAAVMKPTPAKSFSSKPKSASKSHKSSTPKSGSTVTLPSTPETAPEPEVEEEEDGAGSLKIIHENDGYKCPVEGCGKNFRKENLAQMHIKHYHPEYTKFIGSTPNVADLAYARTVGENIEDIVPKTRPPPTSTTPFTTPAEKEKPPKMDSTPKPSKSIKTLPPKIVTKFDEPPGDLPKIPGGASPSNLAPKPANKDSEIIRLLSSEPKFKESVLEVPKVSKDVPVEEKAPEKYPDIKLKDLLEITEGVPQILPKKDEQQIYRTSGIKTLLPVVRSDEMKEESKSKELVDPENVVKSHTIVKTVEKMKSGKKRQVSDKRRQSVKYDTDDMSDYYEADTQSQDSFPGKKGLDGPPENLTSESPQVIIEGGEVIRLVHMRSEEIINCTCGITEEDGLMIQCELCLCWQHGHCNSIERENQVPEKYVCYICKNPRRMRASRKYLHDQDWLKLGALPTANYHAKDHQRLNERFEKLRKSHELSGCLIELNDYIHNLRVKLRIAENKDHPKLYLWNKPWNKPESYGTLNLSKPKKEKGEVLNSSFSSSDHSYIKGGSTFGDLALKSMLEPPIEDIKCEEPDLDLKEHLLCTSDAKIHSQTELLSILQDSNANATNHIGGGSSSPLPLPLPEFPKIDLNSMIANNLPNNLETAAKLEPKQEILKDEILEDRKELGSLASGMSLDLTLSQTDLDRLSLAQLGDVEPVEPVEQPHVPEPEAAIDPTDCRMHLLEHVAHFQRLVEHRLSAVETELCELEDQDSNPIPEETTDLPRSKLTLQMLLRDLSTMRQIASITN